MADAIVGHSRMVAGIGGFDDAVMKDDRNSARVGDAAVAVAAAHSPPAGEGRLDLKLDVVREPFDLEPRRPTSVEVAEAELREVGHEDVGEIDDGRSHRHRPNRQSQDHRIGIVLLDRLAQRRAVRCFISDIAANDLDVVVDLAKDDDHFVAVGDRLAGSAQAPGDRRQDQSGWSNWNDLISA